MKTLRKGIPLLRPRRKQLLRCLTSWNYIDAYMKSFWLLELLRARKASMRSLLVDSIQQLSRFLSRTPDMVCKVQLQIVWAEILEKRFSGRFHGLIPTER